MSELVIRTPAKTYGDLDKEKEDAGFFLWIYRFGNERPYDDKQLAYEAKTEVYGDSAKWENCTESYRYSKMGY